MHTMEYDSGIYLFLWSGKSNLTAAASASFLVKCSLCSDFAKSMSLPCTSKNTLRFLILVKQKFGRLLFCIICHGTYPVFWCLSPQVLEQKCFAAPKELYKFSLVTMLTLDGFGRPSETISVTPWKLSGIRERIWSWTLPSIMFAVGCFLLSVQWSMS